MFIIFIIYKYNKHMQVRRRAPSGRILFRSISVCRDHFSKRRAASLLERIFRPFYAHGTTLRRLLCLYRYEYVYIFVASFFFLRTGPHYVVGFVDIGMNVCMYFCLQFFLCMYGYFMRTGPHYVVCFANMYTHTHTHTHTHT